MATDLPYSAIELGSNWRSQGRTLTEAELATSCMLSGDWHPIHADEEFAKTTRIGRRMFHGTYGIHIAFGMSTPFPDFGDAIIAATGLPQWNYRAPLFVGDTVHVEVEITAKRMTSDGARAVVERRIRLVKQTGEVAQEGIAASLVRIRGTESAQASS